jgi:hypothetical protein
MYFQENCQENVAKNGCAGEWGGGGEPGRVLRGAGLAGEVLHDG